MTSNESETPPEPKPETSSKVDPVGIPVARVRSASPGLIGQLAASYMWLLTIFCLLVAIGLVWWSMPERGIQIVIRFPEGHGLKAEDAVRFRGIDVGTVEQVQLNRQLSGVDVTVNLKPFAEPIAREGSRFWIVRPELSLSQISGLETAVGHKYIGVLPGESDAPGQTIFDGMAQSPPDASDGDGIEITLRGSKRFGISPGSPLSFRGIIVGRVLSVDLARDAQTVETRVRVFEEHAKLVTSKTKFWATSGVDLDLRWGSGIKVDIDSLETIVKGGVSMLTIEQGGKPVQPGQLFEVVSEPEDEWFEMAGKIAVTESENLRAALKVISTWKQGGLIYGTVDKEASFVGTYLRVKDQSWIVIPADVAKTPEKSIEGSFAIQIVGTSETLPLVTTTDAESESMLRIKVNPKILGKSIPFGDDKIRIPNEPEKSMAVRVEGELAEPTFLHIPIDREQINDDWTLKNFDGDREVWHGAPVVSDADGKLIGFLNVQKRLAEIIPVSQRELE